MAGVHCCQVISDCPFTIVFPLKEIEKVPKAWPAAKLATLSIGLYKNVHSTRQAMNSE